MKWIAVLFVLPAAFAAVGSARAEPPLFGAVAVENANLRAFPKWTGMLQRHLEERGREPGSCEEGRFNRCHYERWMALIEEVKGLDLESQLKRVNAEMNRRRYVLDPVNWGVQDYWATPFEFFRKDGDCEDFAIAKFITLKLAGVDPERLRIVVLQDLNLKVAHAVLAVDAGARIRILDNQIRQVVDAEAIRHYQPMYSINERAWWLYRPAAPPAQPPRRARLQAAQAQFDARRAAEQRP